MILKKMSTPQVMLKRMKVIGQFYGFDVYQDSRGNKWFKLKDIARALGVASSNSRWYDRRIQAEKRYYAAVVENRVTRFISDHEFLLLFSHYKITLMAKTTYAFSIGRSTSPVEAKVRDNAPELPEEAYENFYQYREQCDKRSVAVEVVAPLPEPNRSSNDTETEHDRGENVYALPTHQYIMSRPELHAMFLRAYADYLEKQGEK